METFNLGEGGGGGDATTGGVAAALIEHVNVELAPADVACVLLDALHESI
jgi:hypothetical protein